MKYFLIVVILIVIAGGAYLLYVNTKAGRKSAGKVTFKPAGKIKSPIFEKIKKFAQNLIGGTEKCEEAPAPKKKFFKGSDIDQWKDTEPGDNENAFGAGDFEVPFGGPTSEPNEEYEDEKGEEFRAPQKNADESLIKVQVISPMGTATAAKFNISDFPVTIGRDKRNKLSVDDGAVSNSALRLEYEDGEIFAVNTGSKTMRFNGEVLNCSERRQITVTSNSIFTGNTNIIIDVYGSEALVPLRYVTFEHGLYSKRTGIVENLQTFKAVNRVTNVDLKRDVGGGTAVFGYIVNLGANSVSFKLACNFIKVGKSDVPVVLKDSEGNVITDNIVSLEAGKEFYINKEYLKVVSIDSLSIGRAYTET